MQINLSDEQMKAMVAGVILNQLTGPEKDKVLVEAITKGLMEETGGGFGRRSTRLQDAFNAALADTAKKIIAEQFNSDDRLVKMVKSVTEAAIEKALLGDNRTALIDNIANSITKALSGSSY